MTDIEELMSKIEQVEEKPIKNYREFSVKSKLAYENKNITGYTGACR